MKRRPISVTASMLLVLLNALDWLVFAVIVGLDLHPGLPDSYVLRWIMGILAFGCATVMIARVVLLENRVRIAYSATLGLLALLAVLTVADDVGWADGLYLVLVMTPLMLLIKDQSWYTKSGRKTG
jgi:lysylphosphatidylglycerol synthetase-like protein (DUF2156 family)